MHADRPADCPDGKGTASLQTQVKSVEETYGIDNLHLTVARGYVAKLLANTRIIRWLSYHRPECLGEFQKIAEIEAIGPQPEAPEA
ncbi:plasmid partitioning protein RepB C-terminal domain-containing protein [Sinorhizobium meliloti]|uniref:plasmid partitioning protein RepB C-terminal domain-containing protein n=1 Tax=Rhizobium meliloti TaxID=382 RepID=UPI0009B6C036